jgi:hypothetical protein
LAAEIESVRGEVRGEVEGIALSSEEETMVMAMALRIVLHANIGEFHSKFLYTDFILLKPMIESIGGSDDRTTVVGLADLSS